jgi:hypothetical protein
VTQGSVLPSELSPSSPLLCYVASDTLTGQEAWWGFYSEVIVVDKKIGYIECFMHGKVCAIP